ncbi:MAE_28990/MAE_18760 family HEPN-like nuclease [Comamonas sp. A7-5]|uniref:MAE_28990/MAE_18760 family HEPN-like nuclease n=1 Tax=Comamonas sp. A7-5 TaxID=673549 RepID=UPI0031DF0F84
MTRHFHLRSARQEVNIAHARHKSMLDSIRQHSLENNRDKDKFLYLMAIPIIYAAWEGYFRISCSICLKRECLVGKKVKNYKSNYAALWLQKEKFFDSFLQRLFNSMQLGKPAKKISSGKFQAVSEFAANISNWLDRPVDHLYDFDDLVMTYSNVNKEVALLNSGIIGLQTDGVDFSRIDELLSRRNDIAHGGLLNFPHETNVVDLLAYTGRLIDTFHDSVIDWLSQN